MIRKTETMLRPSLFLAALTAFVFLPVTATAQPPEVTPHSVFMTKSDGDDTELPTEEIFCYPAHCKYYDGAFRDTRIWTHTTNISEQEQWIEVCTSNTDGHRYYNHHALRPGETIWVNQVIPKGHWGWIQNWVIIPDVEPPDDPDNPNNDPDNPGNFSNIALTTNTSALFDHPEKGLIRVNEALATTQFGYHPHGTPSATKVDYQPGADNPPWSVLMRHESDGANKSTFEQWQSDADQRLNLAVETDVIKTANGKKLINRQDFDNDGFTDRTTILEFERVPGGKNLYLEVEEGGEITFARNISKVIERNRTTLTTEVDEDGDGTIDIHEVKTTRNWGGYSLMKTQRDLDADGIVDEIETTRLHSRAIRDSSQLTEILTPQGDLKERIQVELSSFDGGFKIVTWHDEDGDGIYDSREEQNSHLSPFAVGTDVETFEIDLGNDGSVESSHTTTTHKSSKGTVYREHSSSDIWSDGTTDAFTKRLLLFDDGTLD